MLPKDLIVSLLKVEKERLEDLKKSSFSIHIEFDDEDQSLEKALPGKIGDRHPAKPWVIKQHPNGQLMYHADARQATSIDRDITDPKLVQNFLNKMPESHRPAMQALITQVQQDPNRHFIPTEESGRQRLRARHLRSLLLGGKDVTIDSGTQNTLKITRHSHSTQRNYPPIVMTYTFGGHGGGITKNERPGISGLGKSLSSGQRTFSSVFGRRSGIYLAKNRPSTAIGSEDLKQPAPIVNLNPEHGKMIANVYESAQHNPHDPQVKAAYGALLNETKQQFQDMINKGFKFTSIKPNQDNPYKTSKDLHSDIRNNKHLYFFPTEQGFGPEHKKAMDHPMLQPTEFMHEGKPLLANDVFRIVHDYRGHYLGGESSFGPKGEHQAYLTHKKEFSPLAQKALAAETLMQNSTVNFGTYGEHNRKNPHQTIYAEQKAIVAPDWIVNGRWHE